MNVSSRFFLFSLAFVSTNSFATDLPIIEHKAAIEISIGASNTEFDTNDYNKIRKVIGNAFANDGIDHLTVYGYGHQGGFSVCVEGKAEIADAKKSKLLLKQLKTIHPQDGTTYSIQPVDHCFTLAANTDKLPTLPVSKPNNSITCDINSGIPLTTMRQELTSINVYSAKKELPNNELTSACGFDTNENNVYEIAETDKEKAISLGFNSLVVKENPIRSILATVIKVISKNAQLLITRFGFVTVFNAGTVLYLNDTKDKHLIFAFDNSNSNGTLLYTCSCVNTNT